MFSKAVVRHPAQNLGQGLTGADLGCPDMELAFAQHRTYVDCLKQAGIKVTALDAVEEYPDSVFVEDTAVMIPFDGGTAAFLTCPGADSRRGEVDVIQSALSIEVDEIIRMEGEGLMEGGDVLLMGKIFYVGIDTRTNMAGYEQFSKAVGRFGYKSIPVPYNDGMPHLKTELSALDEETLIMSCRFKEHKAFSKFEKLITPEDEEYCANCLYLGRKLLVPAGFPATAELLDKKGFTPDYINMSEFQKMDGGLTCLSLRW
ncbi:dimethylarginine dimethylaminohydrolase family protein [Maridesulfovibrio hydrothermalis]|uniref:Dimethylargininase n=1 Tax=Maridesulfovibrio hydrothermalis AM13 = DSM 14728 TaxID=1121451 RepID=L0RBE9_9BACT|nr:arginine deiminase-related protein [Maridesulfovibrio hydrothermalis]CCO23547.1 Dimethylargininase [Maridesulfovibrio hydrothermalis AM13 = DSM 14728]